MILNEEEYENLPSSAQSTILNILHEKPTQCSFDKYHET